ncbi:MAG: HIRAN domain-containing protein [Candidatus Aminicenantes bacterium]|nr:MAG: HIRAN domain-containing protein [Candidatus Aminicenantes bacterium]
MKKKNLIKRIFSPDTSRDSAKIRRKTSQRYFFNEFYIAGYRYYDGDKIEDSLLEGKPVTFKRKPNCNYDPKAVEIYAGRKKLGYIPRKDNAIISSLMDQGVIIKGKIQKRNFDDQTRKRIKISAFKEDQESMG